MNHWQFEGLLLDMPARGQHSCGCAQVTLGSGGVVEGVVETVPASGVRPDLLLMPPLANGHDHVRGIRPAALGGFDLPLELWLTHMTSIPPVDPYLVACAALGRQALSGVGSIMVHYTRPRDATKLDSELATVARAANTIGIRIAIAVAMRDINPLGYAPSDRILDGMEASDRELIRSRLLKTPAPPAEQVRFVDNLAQQIEGPLVSVQFGPYGMEWCSPELLRAIAERSAETGRRVHMHLLESRTQREYLDSRYPEGPLRFLDRLGMLSPRLSIAHAVWLREDEMELLAERGVTVAINACSNLSLKSGIAPVSAMKRHRVPLAMGLDGFSFDDDDDAFRELRLNYLLHRGTAFDSGLPVSDLLHMSSYGGRHSVSGIGAGNGIAKGAEADLLVLDYAAISKDVVVDVDAAHLVARRATAAHVKHLVVSGREVSRNGRLTSLDLPEVQAELDRQTRSGASDFNEWSAVSSRLQARLRQFYEAGLHYCGH
jgi:cytosine/adenosine deaminase-related metal-dependent hydrolase